MRVLGTGTDKRPTVVDRRVNPGESHAVIPGTCDCISLHDQMGFCRRKEVKDLQIILEGSMSLQASL